MRLSQLSFAVVYFVLVVNLPLNIIALILAPIKRTIPRNGLYITHLRSSLDEGHDAEVRRALLQAQADDYEWLKNVFGDKIASLDPNSFIESIAAPTSKVSSGSHSTARLNDDVKVSSTDARNLDNGTRVSMTDDDTNKFLKLGYSLDEIETLLPSVKVLILERSLARPRRGIPPEWLISFRSPQSESSESTSRSVSKKRAIPPQKKENRIGPESDYRDYPRGNKVDNYINKFDSESKQTGAKTTFSWEGSSITEDEESIRRGGDEFSYDRPMSSRRQSFEEDEEEDRAPSEPYEPFNFWPDEKEFKELILEESKWRAGLVGKWASPFIRSEAKWRLNLYRKWLNFLDEGLGDMSGDGFDVVPGGFNDDSEGEGEEGRARDMEGSLRQGRGGGRARAREEWQGDPWESSDPFRPTKRPVTDEVEWARRRNRERSGADADTDEVFGDEDWLEGEDEAEKAREADYDRWLRGEMQGMQDIREVQRAEDRARRQAEAAGEAFRRRVASSRSSRRDSSMKGRKSEEYREDEDRIFSNDVNSKRNRFLGDLDSIDGAGRDRKVQSNGETDDL